MGRVGLKTQKYIYFMCLVIDKILDTNWGYHKYSHYMLNFGTIRPQVES